LKYSPLEELESAVAGWFKQAHAVDVSTDGIVIREKALQIAAFLGADNFTGCNGSVNRFKRRHNTVCRTLAGEMKSDNLETGD
jgi:Tc5 transposase DNA-binding domain.